MHKIYNQFEVYLSKWFYKSLLFYKKIYDDDDDDDLKVSECERDLRVFVSSDIKWSKHVSNKASKANKVLGMLVKNLTCRCIDL